MQQCWAWDIAARQSLLRNVWELPERGEEIISLPRLMGTPQTYPLRPGIVVSPVIAKFMIFYIRFHGYLHVMLLRVYSPLYGLLSRESCARGFDAQGYAAS